MGLGFFKNQGGVAIVGWGCFFQGGFDLFSIQKLFYCNFVCFHFSPGIPEFAFVINVVEVHVFICI